MNSNQTAERPDDPGPEFVGDMSEASHQIIAHDAMRLMAEHLSKQGIAPETIIAALFGTGAGELIHREGAATTVASLRDFAAAIERAQPPTLNDMKASGHA